MNIKAISDIADKVYSWSKNNDFIGYNKHDGLNSPILNALLGWSKWTRILAIQLVMRSPVNIRPLLLVKKAVNPKGLALFASGLLDRYQATGDSSFLHQAEELLDRLVSIRSKGNWHGVSWGYHYPWQDPGFYAAAGTPNAVVTSFVSYAFLDAWYVTNNKKYIETVGSAIEFLLHDLKILKETEDELCLSYMPLPMSMRVMDVSILAGSVISEYAIVINNKDLQKTGSKLLRYVVNKQTDYNAWYYTDPPGASHITHDNYHTGFILDALWRYMKKTGDQQWENKYWKGLEFYAKHHFGEDGAPHWMYDKNYPHDIHGAAQGIITFSRHQVEYPGYAGKIANWAINNMYHPEGRFYYQETRFYRKKFTLMRWCNAWMYRALSSLLLEMKNEKN